MIELKFFYFIVLYPSEKFLTYSVSNHEIYYVVRPLWIIG